MDKHKKASHLCKCRRSAVSDYSFITLYSYLCRSAHMHRSLPPSSAQSLHLSHWFRSKTFVLVHSAQTRLPGAATIAIFGIFALKRTHLTIIINNKSQLSSSTLPYAVCVFLTTVNNSSNNIITEYLSSAVILSVNPDSLKLVLGRCLKRNTEL